MHSYLNAAIACNASAFVRGMELYFLNFFSFKKSVNKLPDDGTWTLWLSLQKICTDA
jgi:hypothetical protein